ncbi:unnamed protein product [Paramecium octaurelia]|uniref:Transmembrane protein n=1 Tax=Paramecium octaurelia TaxID=43137 RepID=A0A8S1TGU0_PAROT|nr:unnamed protein product [Paramecium octaurelia]
MDLEKLLFIIHVFILSRKLLTYVLKIGLFLLPALTLLGLVFIFLLQFREQYKQFLDIQSHEHFNNETIYIFNITDAELKEKNESYLSMRFTINQELLLISNDFQQKYNFSVSTKFIDVDFYNKDYYSILSLAPDLETMFIIDFLDFYQESNISLLNQQTNKKWSWDISEFARKNAVAYDQRLYATIETLFKCILGIFLQSIFASFYLKIPLACSPIIHLYELNCISECQNQELQAQEILEELPWLTKYLNILDRNHKLKKELLDASFQMFILLGFSQLFQFDVYSCSFQLLTKNHPEGLIERFFISFTLIEFWSFLFKRTRSSFYFVPKYIVLTYILFFYYFQSTIYGYYYLAFYICICSQCTIIFYFTLHFEIAALDWSDMSPYTPSFDRPRVCYTPLFSMTWSNDIPPFWTMFYPLCGRRYFQIQNLALVDNNQILLNNFLHQDDDIENDPVQVPNLVAQVALPQQQQPNQYAQINQQFVINADNILENQQPQQQNQPL